MPRHSASSSLATSPTQQSLSGARHKARLSAYYKDESAYQIIYTHKGKDFIGAEYEPLFPYFANLTDPKVCEEMSGQKCEKCFKERFGSPKDPCIGHIIAHKRSYTVH